MSWTSEIEARSGRYADLEAAQQALGELLDPAELERAREQGRALRSRLQAVGAREPGGDPADPGGLRQLDRLLDRLSADTLSMLHRAGLGKGRSRFRRLAEERPETLRLLAGVVLDGDLESDANLRMLEFLVTHLCCERHGREKRVVRDPVEVLPALATACAEHRERIDRDAAAAERRIADAIAALPGQSDVAESRDRMRRYKRGLGIGMLEPRVFAALVAYNAALFNRVEELLEDGRLREALAQDLLEGELEDAKVPRESLFDSAGLERLVKALRQRLRGEPYPDTVAMQLASGCDPAALSSGEVDAFTAPEDESTARLARAAVALGLLLRNLGEVGAALAELGIDAAQVRGPWPRELWHAMTAAAQELLADGRYAEAQRLAAVRSRQLDGHRARQAPERAARPRPRRSAAPVRSAGVPVSSPLLQQTTAGLLLALGLLALAFWQWPAREDRMLATPQLADLSPHLESAYRTSNDGVAGLVGTLGEPWEQLSDPERERVVTELGDRAQALGIRSVILVDRRNRLQGRYQEGEPVWVAPSPRRAAVADADS